MMASSEVAIAFCVADNGLDGRAATELALNDAEDAALLAGDEDAAPTFGFVAAMALVDIGALDGTVCELLTRTAECMAVVGLPANAVACSTNGPSGARRSLCPR